MKKLTKSLLLLGTVLSFNTYAYTVGIAMPTQEDNRWYVEGYHLQKVLIQNGFNVELFYGGDFDLELQKKQLNRLVDEKKVDALVVAALDCGGLNAQLEHAKSNHIPIISYDRLITGTGAIDYYATFDNEKVGIIQGTYIVDKLKPSKDNVINLEIFYGSLDDNNAKFFYNGAMTVLKPYIDEGAIVIKSGEITPQETETKGWSTDLANKRMVKLIEKVGYGPGKVRLDAVLSPADCVSEGIALALSFNGYKDSEFPLITGQDATPDAINRVKNGTMAMTIFKSPAKLGSAVIDMLTALKNGTKVKVNDVSTYNNGVKTVSSYLCQPELIDKDHMANF
ncbi:MAG: sugar-binding protein [Succinivibrio sp.]